MPRCPTAPGLPRAAALPALLLALAAAPAAAAQSGEPLCIITIVPQPDFRGVEVVVDLVLDEASLTDLAGRLDADGDGALNASEAAAHEAATARTLAMDQQGERALRVDGFPTRLAVHERLRGFEGPVNGTAGRVVQEVRRYGAPDVPAQRWHTLTGGAAAREYEGLVVVETVVITAPPGWRVWEVNGTAQNATELTIRGFDTRGSFTIRFAEQGFDPAQVPPDPRPAAPPDRPVPAAGAALALLALAGLAAARRPGR